MNDARRPRVPARSHLARLAWLLVPGLFGVAGCGAGWAAVVGTSSSSSGSSTVAFTVNNNGIDDLNDAEPVDTIDITFSVRVRDSSTATNAVSIRAFEIGDDPPSGPASGDELVTDVAVVNPQDDGNGNLVGNTVRVRLAHPLRLLGRYQYAITAGVLVDAAGRTFGGARYTLQVREGILGDEQLVSFFDRFAQLRILDNLSTLAALQTKPQTNRFLLSVSSAEKDSGFAFPVTVRDQSNITALQANYLNTSAGGNVLVSWIERRNGMVNCSAGATAELYSAVVSSSLADPDDDSPPVPSPARRIDVGIPQGNAYLPWAPRINHLPSGRDLAVWWVWRDLTPVNNGAPFGPYDEFSIWYSSSTVSNGDVVWDAARRLDVGDPNEIVGWPAVTLDENDNPYAIWGVADANGGGTNLADVFDPNGADTLSGFYVARFDPAGNQFSTPVRVSSGPAMLPTDLPRFTSVPGNGDPVPGDRRRAILARPAPGGSGPRAFVFNIDTGALQLADTSSWVGNYPDVGSDVSPGASCVNPNYGAQGPKFPRSVGPITLSNGNPGALVFWFEDGVNPDLIVEELDFEQGFLGNPTVIDSAAPVDPNETFEPDVATLKLYSDLEDNVTIVWRLVDSGARTRVATIRGRRSAVGAYDWATVACQLGNSPAPCSELTQSTAFISDLNSARCATNDIAGLHKPSGRMVIGWTDVDCALPPAQQSPLASLIRFYK